MAAAPTTDTSSSSQQENAPANEAPSGFILKLFQMVNGAPDEVIAWTPEGDAFVIGSDIERLELETLPQYFRHNRFQSLVRQLNFYSFRKINKERNVWIYKHDLFHRERPEDLYMVRRRTCPGMDGRKQRFSRSSSRKQNSSSSSSSSSDQLTNKSDEEASVDSGSCRNSKLADSKAVASAVTKRSLALDRSEASCLQPQPKRTRVVSNDTTNRTNKIPQQAAKALQTIVDSSMLGMAAASAAAKPKAATTKQPQPTTTLIGNSQQDRAEIAEQSLIVSEVAMKLERFARKAKFGRIGGSRGKNGSGVVTPPEGSFSASNGILTYDDEDYGYESDNNNVDRVVSSTSLGGESPREAKSVASREAAFMRIGTLNSGPNAVVSPERDIASTAGPPVLDPHEVEGITQRVLIGSPLHARDSLMAPVTVARFCMSTSPSGDKDLCSKILQLIASCPSLMSEFHNYRSALHPTESQGGDGAPSSFCHAAPRRAVTVQQIWERAASRDDAVRDFRIFAVNCIRKILARSTTGDLGSMTLISNTDRSVLERTADLWQESVCVISM